MQRIVTTKVKVAKVVSKHRVLVVVAVVEVAAVPISLVVPYSYVAIAVERVSLV